MTKPVTPIPVAPIGSRKVGMFVDRADPMHWSGLSGSFEEQTVLDYPPSVRGAALRELRMETPLNMGMAARLFGVTVVQWSGLELGKVTLSEEDWSRVETELRGRRRGAT